MALFKYIIKSNCIIQQPQSSLLVSICNLVFMWDFQRIAYFLVRLSKFITIGIFTIFLFL